MRTRFVLPGVMALGLILAACSGGSSGKVNAAPNNNNGGPTTTVHVAKEAGDQPSESAQMICKEAVKDVNDTLGVNAKVSTPTWKDHVYSCDYQYPHGAVMTMSVKEMSSPEETTAYFNQMADKLGKKQDLAIAQGAFTTNDGSVVVRKDYKVLLVDISKLPAQFGAPPDTRSNDAVNVAYTVMNCWTGA